MPWFGDLPLMMEGGNLDLKYDPNERALLIEPSTIAWGRSRVTIAGKVSSSIEPDGGEVWTYALASVEGRLAPEDGKSLPIEIESWRAEGTYRPASGAFTTEQTLKAGAASCTFRARLTHGSLVSASRAEPARSRSRRS